MTGWVMFGGGIGAMVATAPVEAALHLTSWRGVFVAVSILTFAVAAAVFFVVPERAAGAQDESLREQVRGLGRVFSSGVFWRVAAASALFQATNMALQGLWAGPWLTDVAGLGRPAVALNLLLLAAATTIGFLSWGIAASRLARYGITATLLFKIGTTGFLAVQLLLALGVTTGASLLWIGFGLFGTSGSLAYTILSHAFPLSMSGRANTALNMLVFLLAFTGQWAFGAIVNFWPAGHGQYHPDGYGAAFATLFALQLMAFLWLVLGPPGPDQPAKSRAALS
jgi:predicted MFS family arabinose efflux permease